MQIESPERPKLLLARLSLFISVLWRLTPKAASLVSPAELIELLHLISSSLITASEF